MESNCILMFSGGRDSTLAALRLSQQRSRLTLVTVTSDHLIGIEAVRRRILELRQRLPPDTSWLLVSQPLNILRDEASYARTCLPCHHAYVSVGARVARDRGISTLAFGYTGYQSSWPEQTPYAVERLSAALSEVDLDLVLPVYDLHRKEDAVEELSSHGLSAAALEQKCLRQITNVTLDEAALRCEVDRWEKAISSALHNLGRLPLDIREHHVLGSLQGTD
jgi:hypothetical protein